MTDQKINLNMNLGEIQYLKVLEIIDYKWVHDSQIQNDGSNRLDKIHQCTKVFAVADRKTIDMKKYRNILVW